jgi:hypothetical protein
MVEERFESVVRIRFVVNGTGGGEGKLFSEGFALS